MSRRHRRFRGHWFRGRRSGSIAPEQLESVLREPVLGSGDDDSFENSILDRVEGARPFLDSKQRRQIRWGRTVLSGSVLGLLFVGAIAMRQGLIPTGHRDRPITTVLEVAQRQGQDSYEEAIAWRARAFERLADLSQQPMAPQWANPSPGNRADHSSAPERGVCIGFSMQEPYNPLSDADHGLANQLIVFDDGLAVPVAGSYHTFGDGPSTTRIERWPSAAEACQLLIGDGGGSANRSSGVLPPWYGSPAAGSVSSDQPATGPHVQSH